jgi:hypothetical protein
MNNFDVNGFLQFLEDYGIEPKFGIIIVIVGILALAIILALVIVYLLRHNAGSLDGSDIQPKSASSPTAVKLSNEPGLRKSEKTDNTPQREKAEQYMPLTQPTVAVANPVESPSGSEIKRLYTIPQDSILRRHYLTHVRYMVEAVSNPRPSESVLRRHYEQLISSQVETCLKEDTAMERLLKRYDEYRKSRCASATA